MADNLYSFLQQQTRKPTEDELFLEQLNALSGGRGPAGGDTAENDLMAKLAKQQAAIKSLAQPNLPPAALAGQLPPHTDPRQTAMASDGSKSQAERVKQSALTWTPEQFKQAQMLAEESPEIQELRGGTDSMLKQLALLAGRPNQVDLSPMFAMIDDPGKREALIKTYQKPENMKPNEMFEYANEIQKRREAIASKIQDLMQTQKAGSDTERLLTAITGAASVGFKPAPASGEGGDRRDMKWLSDKLSPYSNLIAQFGELDREIGGIDKWRGEEIPGMGLTGKLPLAGLSAKGSKIKQLVTGIQNDLLYLRSGAQINEQEYRRLSGAIGGGVLSGDRDRVQGLKNFRNAVIQMFKNRAAGVEPKLVDEFVRRGGVSLGQLQAIGGGGTGDTGSPIGTVMAGRGGVQYKKVKSGPDSDRSAWQEVK